jgi:pyruvate kinase
LLTGLTEVAAQLDSIRAEMHDARAKARGRLDLVQPQHRSSASNLLDYLTLRKRDLRPLQTKLAQLGLSSLGRSEGQVLGSIDAVRRALSALAKSSFNKEGSNPGTAALLANTEALLGPPPAQRQVRIMVTMPGEAAHDYTLIHDLVRSGMDCMRINCAHDDVAAWAQMIEHLRRANQTRHGCQAPE